MTSQVNLRNGTRDLVREIIKARVSGYQQNFIAVYHKIKQFLTSILQVNLSLKFKKNHCVNFKSNSIYSETRFQFGCSTCRTQCVYLLFFCFLNIYCKFCVLLYYMTIIKKIMPEIMSSEQYFFY